MKHSKILLFFLILMLAAYVAGCTVMPFEDPADQRRQEKQAAEQQAAEEPVVPSDLLDTDLTMSEKLNNNAGQTLALYTAELPQFVVDEAKKGQSFQRINEYYQSQLKGYKEDCESLFAMAREHFGANWASASAQPLLFSTEMSYSLTDAPNDYLCVLHTYKLRDGTADAEVYREAEVFLMDNGWRLTLQELFGSNYEKAEPLLIAGIRNWCTGQGMNKDAAAKLKVADFEQGFGMDADSLMFFLPPFTLSATDSQARTVSLPLQNFADLLPENIAQPAAQPENDSPSHSA